MTIVTWTGLEVAALRAALRDTQVQFADRIGCSLEAVGKWERRGADITLGAKYSECMDTTRRRLDDEQRTRFEAARQDRAAALRISWGAISPGRNVDGHTESTEHSAPIVGVGPITDPVVSVDVDNDYVDTLRSRIRQLVDLDATFGGDQSSEFALQLFRSVHRKLGTVRCDPRIERELYAAAGEIGEVTGWLLYDAGEHELVRRVNNEALHLSRMAGDRSMELLTLQNMSMHAGSLGRPVEALRIARMVLETNRLSPRLEALFRIREARALAQAGDDTSAKRSFRRARSLYLDGTRDGDPAWAWWIDDRELAWHEAVIHSDCADWSKAADTFSASVEFTPHREIRSRYHHLAALFNAEIRAHAWHDAAGTIRRVVPLIDEIRSTRTATILLEAVGYLDTVEPAHSIRDETRQLRDVLAGAGYGR
ncbi:helix-turn-helix domain-containing protein [Nocardia sp. NPDC051750]|uniref:helix-turn-helix domain-containing protein n=1 Tax=Nocardia sp. NPDC051750 TaxID=3364325 RepID=UPI0037AEE5C9